MQVTNAHRSLQLYSHTNFTVIIAHHRFQLQVYLNKYDLLVDTRH